MLFRQREQTNQEMKKATLLFFAITASFLGFNQ